MGKLCRLCLNVATPEKIIHNLTKNMLQTLSINVELSVHSVAPVMCGNCESVLKQCFDFVRVCESSKQSLQPLGFPDERIQREIESKSCLFCTNVVNEDQCYSLRESEEEMVASQKFISDCILQLYAAAPEEPVACESCHECLNTYMSFSKTCLASDGKIKRSLKESLRNIKSRVRRVYDISSSSETGQKPYDEIILKSEETLKEEEATHGILHAHLNLEEDEPEIVKPTTPPPATQQVYTCTSCPFTTTHKYYLNRHARKHADVIPLYKCDRCDFKTKNQWYLPVHAICHSDPNVDKHKCPKCDYETRNPKNMKRHLVNHDDSVQFSCQQCPFTTKFRVCLKRHQIAHKTRFETKTYKCQMCPYESKYSNLKTHVLQHKTEGKVKMYKCDRCSYKAKRKGNLVAHQLVHNDKKDMGICECEVCSSEMKRRTDLIHHSACHRKRSTGQSFDCPLCGFRTKRKMRFKQHMKTHNDKKQSESSLDKSEPESAS